MKTLRNEKGFALAVVLILAMIALVMTLGMLLMVSRGSYVSGQQKRYRTASEAGRGGMEAMLQLVQNGGLPEAYMQVDNQANLHDKLTSRPPSGAAWTTPITIDPGDSTTYDMRVDLGAYRVYSKIVDTVQGKFGDQRGAAEKRRRLQLRRGHRRQHPVPVHDRGALPEHHEPDRALQISVLYQY